MAAVADKKKQKRTNAQAALSEPKAKKARFESAAGTTKSSADKGKKRSQPVTLPLKEDNDNSSDEGSELEYDEAEESEGGVGEDGPSQAPKDPNGTSRTLIVHE